MIRSWNPQSESLTVIIPPYETLVTDYITERHAMRTVAPPPAPLPPPAPAPSPSPSTAPPQ